MTGRVLAKRCDARGPENGRVLGKGMWGRLAVGHAGGCSANRTPELAQDTVRATWLRQQFVLQGQNDSQHSQKTVPLTGYRRCDNLHSSLRKAIRDAACSSILRKDRICTSCSWISHESAQIHSVGFRRWMTASFQKDSQP